MDIHWYDFPSFKNLLSKYKENQPEMKLRLANSSDKSESFLGLFHKLTNYRSQHSAVIEELKGIKTLSELSTFDNKTLERLSAELLVSLKEKVKLSKDSIEKFGSIGKENFKGINEYNHFSSEYVEKTDNKSFLVVELLAVKIDDCPNNRDVNWGINFTACYEEIDFSSDIESKKIKEIIRKLKKQGNIVYAHLISPNFSYSTYSKNQINFSDEHLEIIAKAFTSLYNKIGKKENKEGVSEENKEVINTKRKTVKGVIGEIAQEIYDRQSENSYYPLTMRNYFYAMRDEVKKRFLGCYYVAKGKNFLLSQWGDKNNHYSLFRTYIYDLMDNDLIKVPRLKSDPRGYLYEPYTGAEIKLGTTQVDDYEIPTKQYQGILYIEKENPIDLLNQENIGKKYDILICAGKGYAVRATKALLRKCGEKEGFKLFCIHDADPSGYMIYQDLVNKVPDIEIIDLGLNITEAIEEMKIKPENLKITDSIKTLVKNTLNLTDKDRHYFTNEQCRVEISVLPPGDFVAWVDRKLSEYLPEKRLPNKEELKEEIKPSLSSEIKRKGEQHYLSLESELTGTALRGLRKEREKMIRPFRRKEERIIKKLRLGRLKPQVNNVIESKIKELLNDDYIDFIKEELKDNPYQSWTDTTNGIVDNTISHNLSGLKDSIEKIMTDN